MKRYLEKCLRAIRVAGDISGGFYLNRGWYKDYENKKMLVVDYTKLKTSIRLNALDKLYIEDDGEFSLEDVIASLKDAKPRLEPLLNSVIKVYDRKPNAFTYTVEFGSEFSQLKPQLCIEHNSGQLTYVSNEGELKAFINEAEDWCNMPAIDFIDRSYEGRSTLDMVSRYFVESNENGTFLIEKGDNERRLKIPSTFYQQLTEFLG